MLFCDPSTINIVALPLDSITTSTLALSSLIRIPPALLIASIPVALAIVVFEASCPIVKSEPTPISSCLLSAKILRSSTVLIKPPAKMFSATPKPPSNTPEPVVTLVEVVVASP